MMDLHQRKETAIATAGRVDKDATEPPRDKGTQRWARHEGQRLADAPRRTTDKTSRCRTEAPPQQKNRASAAVAGRTLTATPSLCRLLGLASLLECHRQRLNALCNDEVIFSDPPQRLESGQ